MRIFENCRFFNPENSPITKTADNLESYFAQKLTLLREMVVNSEIWKRFNRSGCLIWHKLWILVKRILERKILIDYFRMTTYHLFYLLFFAKWIEEKYYVLISSFDIHFILNFYIHANMEAWSKYGEVRIIGKFLWVSVLKHFLILPNIMSNMGINYVYD